MSDLKALEAALAQHQDDLNTCNDMLALDPDYADALEQKPVLEADIVEVKSKIAALKAQQDAAPPPPPGDDVPPPPPKYDMSKHPKFRKTSPEAPPPPPEETQTQTVFNVKDVVQAKFSEDKQWYTATITSKTGSSTDPVYKVTFKGYGNTETKRKFEVRPLENPNAKKRKAEGPPPPATSAPTAPESPKAPTHNASTTNNTVISAAPAIDTTKPAKREPSKVSDGPTRMAPEPKKLKGSKALDKSQNSWQSFRSTGPKKGAAFGGGAMKKINKESQFRTPDLPGAKVGFTGSGRPMQKDQARSKWNYGRDAGDD